MRVFDSEDPDRLWKELILVFATFFLPGFVLQWRSGGGQSFDDPVYLISILLQSVPQAILVVYIVQIGEKGNLENFGFRALTWSDLPKGILVCLATLAVIIPLQAATGSGEGREPTFVWTFSDLALAPLVLAATLAAAYREEVFFRAYAATRLRQLGSTDAVAVIGPSVVFGLGHVYQGMGGFLTATVIGLLMGAVFLRTSNLHALGIGHGLYNFVVLVAGSESAWMSQ